MDKETLGDIVKKSLRFANSVVDSAYDFPDVRHCLEPEERFRELLNEYFTTYETNSMRGPVLKEMLGYMASRHEDNYGEKIPGIVKRVKRLKTACAIVFFWQPKIQKLLDEEIKYLTSLHYDSIKSNDTAKELRETDYKLLDKALYDDWIEIKMLLDDVSEPVKEKLERIKKHK